MGISRIIKHEGNNADLIWKYPGEDFNSMTELIVNESQEAIFVANGQIADVFGPGRYKLASENIPILTKMVNIATGVSIFHCTVYFINKTVRISMKWGTDSKARFIEPIHKVPIEIGASGSMDLLVSDGQRLLTTLVGTTGGIAWDYAEKGFTNPLEIAFKPKISAVIKSILPTVIKKNNIDILEIDERLMELSDRLCVKILPHFEEFGLTISRFYLNSVILPENDPNFRKFMEIRTVKLQKAVIDAQTEIRISQTEHRALAATADAEAEARIKAAQREVILEGQKTEIEVAKMVSGRKIIEAQADADINLISGKAKAEVMREQGYSQKDVINAEILKAFAEGIGNAGSAGSGGGGNNVMGGMVQLGVGMAAMEKVMPQLREIMESLSKEPNTGAADDNKTGTPSNKCPECGTVIPIGAKFCMQCGQPLT